MKAKVKGANLAALLSNTAARRSPIHRAESACEECTTMQMIKEINDHQIKTNKTKWNELGDEPFANMPSSPLIRSSVADIKHHLYIEAIQSLTHENVQLKQYEDDDINNIHRFLMMNTMSIRHNPLDDGAGPDAPQPQRLDVQQEITATAFTRPSPIVVVVRIHNNLQ